LHQHFAQHKQVRRDQLKATPCWHSEKARFFQNVRYAHLAAVGGPTKRGWG
jgi:hypothetical protein